MKYSLIVQPEAEEDAAEVVDHLEGIAPGLGRRFLDELDDLYDHIERFPMGFQKRYKDYRHGYLRHFPYRVAYLVEGTFVYIYQVRHMSRREDPEFGP